MKRNFKLFILFFALVLIGGASMLFMGQNQVFADASQNEQIEAENAKDEQQETRVGINSVAGNTLANAAKPVGDLKNNLFVLGFKGESNPFAQYGTLYNNYSQYDFFNQYFNKVVLHKWIALVFRDNILKLIACCCLVLFYYNNKISTFIRKGQTM